jgi:hypothetical protein
MSAQGRDHDFGLLLQRLVDGELSDRERTQVADMMSEDAALRAAYLDHCQMHALLQTEHGLLAATAPEGGDFAAVASEQLAVRRLLYALAAAAALLVVCGWWWQQPASPSAPFRGASLAVLKTAVGVQFAYGADGEAATPAGASLPQGPYDLKAGLIELEYASGVLLTVEAPARFELVDETIFRLAHGRVAAHVPPQGIGFQVEAPAATVVDLGTDFAVDATADEDSEVHVFKGEVRVELLEAKGAAGGPLRLLSGQATRVDFLTGLPAGIDLDEQRFMRSLRAEPQGYAQQVLALNPAVYYRMEPAGNGRTLVDQSPSGADAQVVLGKATKPVWVAGKVGSALQLGGPADETYAVAPSYPQSTTNELAVVAWVYARTRPRWASIAKNWAGASDRGQFHFGLLDDVGALEGHIADANGEEITVRDDQPLPLRQWHHVALVADGSMLRLYRNGREVSAAPYVKLTHDPRILALAVGTKLNLQGAAPEERDFNMWDGRLDELAIFNHALSADEVRRLFELARSTD